MYAIIATGGKQYKVSEGDVIKVEKLGVEAGSAYTFDQVLVVGGEETKVGDPVVAGARLSFTSTREKQATTKNRVTDSLILKLRLKKLMLN